MAANSSSQNHFAAGKKIIVAGAAIAGLSFISLSQSTKGATKKSASTEKNILSPVEEMRFLEMKTTTPVAVYLHALSMRIARSVLRRILLDAVSSEDTIRWTTKCRGSVQVQLSNGQRMNPPLSTEQIDFLIQEALDRGQQFA
ncbi:hypothetical protein V1522DRAFT_423575 [Lipomyces starkeyi]